MWIKGHVLKNGLRTIVSRLNEGCPMVKLHGSRGFGIPYSQGEILHGNSLTECEADFRTVAEFVYNAMGDMVERRTYTNATDYVTERFAYDHEGREIASTNSLGGVVTTSYDPRGNVTAVDGATYPLRMEYDLKGRRTSLKTTRDGESWDTTRWPLDPATGRCLSKTYADNSTISYTHIPDGLPARTTWLYAYDAEDRLVSVTSASLTNGAFRVENAYDWRDRRISKTMSRYDSTDETWNVVERRVFTYDDWNLVHETIMQISGVTPITTEIQYFWGFDLSETLQGAGGVGGLLAVSINDSFYFPCYDNNGNVTKYVDETGTVAASYAYDDFGRVVSQSGPLADAFPHRFSTKHFDAETGLCYYGRRFYSPLLKRWLNRDPIEEQGGMNLYLVCQNHPVFIPDVNGLYELTLISDYTAQGDVLSWYLLSNSGNNIQYGIQSKKHLFAEMAKQNLRFDSKITVLNLSGHGVGGGAGISFANSTAFDFTRLTKDDMNSLRFYLAPNAVIRIWSCEAAATYQKCISLQNAAHEIEATIYAKTNEVEAGPDGTFLSKAARRIAAWIAGSNPGEWKVFHPRPKIQAHGYKETGQKKYKITVREGGVIK